MGLITRKKFSQSQIFQNASGSELEVHRTSNIKTQYRLCLGANGRIVYLVRKELKQHSFSDYAYHLEEI